MTRSPVLFIIFNRPDTTLRVFNEIRKARPSRLYIAADGPRPGNTTDTQLTAETRRITAMVDWDCDVKTLFREQNLGCKEAVSSAIGWFFTQEEEGIILEDDCLPSPSFFTFCDTLLEKYRYDQRIRHIAGANLQLGQRWGAASYYFSSSTNVWGWASWRRVWKDYDKDLRNRHEEDVKHQLNNVFADEFLANRWLEIFKQLKENKIDTWDYQLSLTNYFYNGLSVNPNVNLIQNIGFRADATHTPDPNATYANLPLQEITEITHPDYFIPEKNADFFTFNKEFHLEENRKKHYSLRRRFKRWLRKTLGINPSN